MELGLDNKTAIVTGSSKGIGLAIARELAREGCNVIIAARSEQELSAAEDEMQALSGQTLAVTCDVTQEDDLKRLVETTADAFGGIDILVNNAGGIGSNAGVFHELTLDDWREIFELNLFSVVTLTRLVLPYMQEQQWGRIINISSENAEQPYPDMCHYNVTKAALNNLTKTLSKTYGKENILVNTVSPAFIETPLVEGMMKQQAESKGIAKEEMIHQFLKNNRPGIVMERPGKEEEVAAVVAFLVSERASFITGSLYRVDGGSVMSV